LLGVRDLDHGDGIPGYGRTRPAVDAGDLGGGHLGAAVGVEEAVAFLCGVGELGVAPRRVVETGYGWDGAPPALFRPPRCTSAVRNRLQPARKTRESVVLNANGLPIRFAADYVAIGAAAAVRPVPGPGPAASTGAFTSRCGRNIEGHRNSDNFITAAGRSNGAHHVHDYVGNTSADGTSIDWSLAASGTTCADGDRSVYFWPVCGTSATPDPTPTARVAARTATSATSSSRPGSRSTSSATRRRRSGRCPGSCGSSPGMPRPSPRDRTPAPTRCGAARELRAGPAPRTIRSARPGSWCSGSASSPAAGTAPTPTAPTTAATSRSLAG
jgi:hypothetical protein